MIHAPAALASRPGRSDLQVSSSESGPGPPGQVNILATCTRTHHMKSQEFIEASAGSCLCGPARAFHIGVTFFACGHARDPSRTVWDSPRRRSQTRTGLSCYGSFHPSPFQTPNALGGARACRSLNTVASVGLSCGPTRSTAGTLDGRDAWGGVKICEKLALSRRAESVRTYFNRAVLETFLKPKIK